MRKLKGIVKECGSSMLIVALILVFFSLVFPLIFQADDINDERSIKLEFRENSRGIMIFGIVVFLIVAIIFFVLSFRSEKKEELVGVVIFSFLAFVCSLGYLQARNKKILYSDGYLHVYNFFGKLKTFNIQDIKEVEDVPLDGMKILFNDGKKIKVDMQMTNYDSIKEIVSNNINSL